MRFLLRPVCWALGHRRGKEAALKGDGYSDDRAVLQARGAGLRLFRCPRCGRETRYKIKPNGRSNGVATDGSGA